MVQYLGSTIMIERLVKGSKKCLIICSPWIAESGVQKLREYLSSNTALPTIEVWTRLAEVLTDSRGIASLAQELIGRGTKVVIRDSKDLHAKIYYADSKVAIFGSANLGDKGIDNGLEIVASCINPAEVTQVKAVLKSIKPKEVSLEELNYFNINQRPELEKAEREATKPNIVPIWRRTTYSNPSAKGEERRAFLVGDGMRGEKVQFIAKTYRRNSGFSTNLYHFIKKTKTKSYPDNYHARIPDLTSRGYEVKEPRLNEDEIREWVEYGLSMARELGLKVEA